MMKELTCVLVVIIGVVNATPYGYGVKSGAGTKAEAHAVAGAYGGYGQVAPVQPSSGGYSGSYSKSSSSSFASSAASASSSSFSFSGAGSYGANGAPSYGKSGSPAGNGCSSGACPNGGVSPSSYEASNNGNIQPFGSGANAAAGAAAGAYAGSQGVAGGAPCTGSNCDNANPLECQGPDCDTSKCTTGQCKSDTAPTKPTGFNSNDDKCSSGKCGSAADSQDHKCTSGKCAPKSPSDHSENENDIPVKVSETKSRPDSNQQASTAYDEASTDYTSTSSVNSHSSQSPCDSGNCGTPTTSYLKPTQPNKFSSPSVSQGNPVKCNSPHCNTLYNTPPAVPSNPTVPSGNAPSTYFTTPNEGAKCTSSNCNTGNTYPKPEYSPSSYNVPINGYETLPPKGYNVNCASGNCDKPAPSFNSGVPHKFLSPPTSNNVQSGNFGTPCNTPNCASGNSFNLIPKGPNTYPQYQAPSLSSGPSCTHGNCAGSPPSNVNFGIGTPGFPGPNANVRNPSRPSYSQGPVFVPSESSGSPQNCDGSNCGGSQPSSPSSPESTFPSFVALHEVKPSNAGPTPGVPVSGNSFYQETNTGVAPQKQPAYTGGFGGSSGFLKPNENDVPVKSPGPINFDKPVITASSNSPTASGCDSGNCGVPSGNIPHYGQSAGQGAYVAAGASASANAVAYTGGFGGPPGLLKPFDDGKLENPSLAGATSKHSLGLHSNTGLHGNGEHFYTGDSSGAYPGSTGLTNAGTGSGAGAYNGGYNHQDGYHGNHGAGSCNKCGGNGAGGSYGGNSNFGLSGGYGLEKNGLLGGSLAGAASAAKSITGGGSGSFGLGGSFATSGAFSHSGAATKGGYGGK